MDVHKINNEMTYQLTMIQAKLLLDNGALTVEEFEQFRQLMLEKYQPFISRLSTK